MALPPSSIIAGTLFGAALTYSEVFHPEIIIHQLRWQNMHMFRVFLGGTASSAVVIAILSKANLYRRLPRSSASIGLFSSYDANIIGGLLIGIGMALSGACPGTVLSQVGTGISSAFPTLIGAILGGLAWCTFAPSLRKPIASKSEEVTTFHGRLELEYIPMVAIYVGACIVMVLSLGVFDTGKFGLHKSLAGGLAIGGAQAACILLTTNSVGCSGAYEESAKWILYLTGQRRGIKPATSSTFFAIGVIAGSFVLEYFHGASSRTRAQQVEISLWKALMGGAALAFGGRLAGGCTSGHGISGLATMSISSLVSVIAMFGGGIVAAALLN